MSRGSKNPLKIVEQMEKSRTVSMKNTHSSPKLQKARAILDREEQNAKCSRLESLLVQQYTGKFGARNGNSRVNKVIQLCVHNFISENGADIDNAMLDVLERKVRDLAQSAKDEIVTSREDERMSKARDEQQMRAQRKSEAQRKAAENAIPEDPKCDLNQWAVVNAMMAINDKEDKQKEARRLQERKQLFKADLDRQVELHQAKNIEVQLKKKSDKATAASAYEEYKQQEMLVKQERDAKLIKERELKMAQIEEKKRRIAAEREEKIAQERQQMERSKRLQEMEVQRIAEKKEREKAQMDIVKMENEANKAIKAAKKREQDEYEKKLNSDYEMRLAKEEMERTNAFAKRMEKLGNASKKFEQSTGVVLQQQRELNEQKTMQEIKLKNERDAEREREKLTKRQHDLMEATKFNFDMAQRKKEQEKANRERDINVRLAAEAAYRETKEEERRQKEIKLKKMNELRQVLDGQVEVRKKNIKNAQVLTEEEKMLNKSIIQKIERDPELKHKVVNAVVPAAASYSTFAW